MFLILRKSQVKYLLVVLMIAAGVFVSLHPSAAARRSPEVQEIIDRVDRLYRSDTSYGEIEMTIITPDWRRRLRMKIWTEGMDKTFLYITSPQKDAGIATLRIGSEMWNYFPKINKVMKVPPSMMMGSWMGSDFTNDDLVKESSLLRDYSARLINPEGADKDHYSRHTFQPCLNSTLPRMFILTWGPLSAPVANRRRI